MVRETLTDWWNRFYPEWERKYLLQKKKPGPKKGTKNRPKAKKRRSDKTPSRMVG